MSTLIFTLPLHSEAGASYSQTVLPTQTAGARDKEIWAIVPAAALSWHRITLPAGLQRQTSRLNTALQSLMEEPLLDEPEAMHLSMQAEWEANSPGWVAACNKAWLKHHLSQLQAMGHVVHRIVPEWAPSTVKAEVSAWVSGTPEDAWLWVNDAQGAWRLPLVAGMKYWSEQLQSLANAQDIPAHLTLQADPAVADLARNALHQLQSNNQAAFSDGASKWSLPCSAMQKPALPIGIWRSLNLQRTVLRAGCKKPIDFGKLLPRLRLGNLRVGVWLCWCWPNVWD